MLKRGSGAQNPVSLFAFFSRAVLHGELVLSDAAVDHLGR